MQTETAHQLAIAEVTPIVADIAAYGDTIEGIEIVDDEELTTVGDLVKMLQRRRLKLEDKRKSLTGPLNKVVKDINDLFKGPRDAIDAIVAKGKKHMDNYVQAQHAIADAKRRAEREAAEQERREAEDMARKLANMSEVGKETADKVIAQAEAQVVQTAKPAKVAPKRGRTSTVITTKVWKAEVLDVLALAKGVAEGRLPTHMIEPNMRALTEMAREMKKDIEVDGVRFYQHVSSGVR